MSIIRKTIIIILIVFLGKRHYHLLRQAHIEKQKLKITSRLHQNGKKVLKDLDTFFQKYSTPYWLISGTLLGVMRDKSFIKGDLDIDIGVFVEDIELLYNTLKKDRFTVSSYFVDKSNLKTQLRLSHLKVDVDIFIFKKYENGMYQDEYRPTTNSDLKTNLKKLGILRYYFDDYFPTTIKRHTFGDVEVNIPKNWKKCLDVYYGPNWNIPIDTKEYETKHGWLLPLEDNKNPHATHIKGKYIYPVNNRTN